jgi:hypothetical protein
MSSIKSSKIFTITDRDYSFLKLDNTQATDSNGDPDAITYIKRVKADGGTIVDEKALQAAFIAAKKDGWYYSAALWFIGCGGMKYNGTNVSKWYNAGTIGVYGDASNGGSNQPSFVSSDSLLNGKPSLRFDTAGQDNGRTLTITGAQGYWAGTGATVFTAHNVTNDDLYAVFGTNNNDQWWRVGGSTIYPGCFRNSRVGGIGANPAQNGSQYWTITSNSSAYVVRINGTQQFSTSADYSAGSSTFYISDIQGRNDRALRGTIGELIVFNSVASASAITAVEAMLKSKYGM